MRAIFASPLYTGARGAKARAEPGGFLAFNACHWLPLLGHLTGARLEELAQLRPEDVRLEPVPHLILTEEGEGQSVKTGGSRRAVPVHPELVRLGFLRFAADRRAAGAAWLFPELTVSPDGRRSAAWSKWWGRFTAKLGLADPRLVFHSWRHSFKSACRAAAIPEDVHDGLTGHAGGGVGRRYGARELLVLAREMARIVPSPALAGVPVYRPERGPAPARG